MALGKDNEAKMTLPPLDGEILFETSPHPMMVFERDSLAIVRVNQSAITTYGYSREEFLALTVEDLKPEEDIPALYDVVRNSGSGPERPGIWRHLTKAGETRWMDIAGHNLEYDGKPARLAILLDVTHIVELEREHASLHASEMATREQAEAEAQSFRSVLESASGKFAVVRAGNFEIFAVSDEYLAVTGRTRNELIGREIFSAFPDNPVEPDADGVSRLEASFRRVCNSGSTDVMALQRYPIEVADGKGGGFEERWWHIVNTPVLGPGGQVSYIINRVEDVTGYVREGSLQSDSLPATPETLMVTHELAQAARRMREQETNLRTAQELLGIGVWKYHLATRTHIWSDEVKRIYGDTSKCPTISFRDHALLVHPDDRDALYAQYRAFESSGNAAFEFQYRIIRLDTGRIVHGDEALERVWSA